MARYVDGFVIPVPKNKVAAYKKIAAKAGKTWKKYGALGYIEAAGDDLKVKCGLPFPDLAKIKTGETVIFSYIVYKSKAHRDRVNAQVMKDPAIRDMMEGPQIFDCNRMSYGGFEVIVDM